MWRYRDLASVRVLGDPARRARWYGALALAMLGNWPVGGVVFESSSRAPVPVVTVRPAHVLDSLRMVDASAGVRLERFPTVPSLDPPERGLDRLGALVPLRSTREDLREPVAVAADLPPLPAVVSPSVWLGLQTFWIDRGRGTLEVATRFRVHAPDRPRLRQGVSAFGARLIRDWGATTSRAAEIRRLGLGAVRDWRRGSIRTFPLLAWTMAPPGLERTPDIGLADFRTAPATGSAHTVVFGASGAGKTSYLAERSARAIDQGRGVVVVDLHGDLAPRVVARLSASGRSRVVAVDAGDPPVPGVAGLVGRGVPLDRAAAHFVAAIKRLSPDGTDLAWGFRLERIFDALTRVVLDSGGTIVDLYALLTDADRRDAMRLTSRRAVLRHFLDELEPLVRRNPDFLWSAATRLSKVVLVPALVDLLAPADGGLDVERLVEERRALLVRLPFATLGPEAASFAGTLVLARTYLGLAARAAQRSQSPPVLLVLDEVHGFSPRLVAELLAEGRKFGVEALVATQYPDRLAPEVRSAAAGAAGSFVAFRVPPATAPSAGEWLGMARGTATSVLPALSLGVGLVVTAGTPGVRALPPVSGEAIEETPAWTNVLDRTRSEFDVPSAADAETDLEPATERLLLAVFAAAESGTPLSEPDVRAAAGRLPGDPIAPERLERAWSRLARGPELEVHGGGLALTDAGERRLGVGRPTGASRETAEHRALLLRAFRVFARRGYLIEILRQGRFDTTLPDARFHQLGLPGRVEAPAELARRIERARTGWAWRCFAGRDVLVEAEVSGALRADRIRHGCAKAAARGCFVLFVVGDAHRARRVRATLGALGLRPDRAQVWTLAPRLERPKP